MKPSESQLSRNDGGAKTASLWHVSPLVDTLAYHFSWLWVLVPLLAVGERHPADYLALFAVVTAVNFAHRHFTLPYVYLDPQNFAQHRLRFLVEPILCVAALLASPSLWRLPTGRAVIGGIAFVAVLWNIWHVYMQKYGILRLHHAKAVAAATATDPSATGRPSIPGWVDRLLVFAWMPLYFVYLGPAYRHLLVEHARSINAYLLPMVDALTRLQPYLLGPAVAFAAASVCVFLWHEHRTFGLRNRPRLSAAAGITLLSACFIFFNPVKVYMAFAFSHAVEYMVFVWAFQRRRYSAPERQSPLARWVRRPWVFYPALLAVFGGGYLLIQFWGKSFLIGQAPLTFAGTPVVHWLFFWGIYQSLMHFDYDGVLWRMRQPQVRGNI